MANLYNMRGIEQTDAEWSADEEVYPRNCFLFITDGVDAGKFKRGDGVSSFSELDFGAESEGGKDGADGATGPQGPQGEKGEKGDVGPIGPEGPQGETGATGPAGEDGADA